MNDETIMSEIKGLKELFNEKFRENEKSHDAILDQTKKTNGNVIGNAQRITRVEEWKNKVVGALIMTNIIILPILFIVVKNWFHD